MQEIKKAASFSWWTFTCLFPPRFPLSPSHWDMYTCSPKRERQSVPHYYSPFFPTYRLLHGTPSCHKWGLFFAHRDLDTLKETHFLNSVSLLAHVYYYFKTIYWENVFLYPILFHAFRNIQYKMYMHTRDEE